MYDVDLDARLVRHHLRVRGDEAHLLHEYLAPLAALVVEGGRNGDNVGMDAGKDLPAVPAIAANTPAAAAKTIAKIMQMATTAFFLPDHFFFLFLWFWEYLLPFLQYRVPSE